VAVAGVEQAEVGLQWPAIILGLPAPDNGEYRRKLEKNWCQTPISIIPSIHFNFIR